MSVERSGRGQAFIFAAFAAVVAAQALLGLWGADDLWTRGHNGWNGAAYQNAARNTLRWNELFPLQYETGNAPPDKEQLYTHAPLGLHLHNVASLAILGDRESSIRLVAAFWSVAAVCALFFVVRRLWGDVHALIAVAVYVALPINAIYINMANHSAGFITWSLIMLYVYVAGRAQETWSNASFGLLLASLAIATSWDWPAYYVAFCIAVHWLATRRPEEGWMRWMIFCASTLAMFGLHLALVEGLAGGAEELLHTVRERQALPPGVFGGHARFVLELMFTWPVLATCAAWLAAWGVRAVRGAASARDIVPIAFLVAGLSHYLLFRWDAVVHSYWAWPALPFVAIALCTSLVAVVAAVRDWVMARLGGPGTPRHRAVSILVAVVVGATLLGPLAMRDRWLIRAGRSVGGSMWFVVPVLGFVEPYDSGRPELELAKRVRGWTSRDTAVQLHPAFITRRVEPRFDITLDRATFRYTEVPQPNLPLPPGTTGWVFLAPIGAVAAETVSRYPHETDPSYVFLDLREHTSAPHDR